MIYRSIYERVPKAAPFLKFDGDPYCAVVDGRLVWIWDAYTTTDQYPYSQPIDLGDVASTQEGVPALAGDVNYLRNSVKVVVDAYDGSMTYYVTDPTDPIIQVWQKAFPELFTPLDEAPASLLEHFRYPENLFQVQAAQYANYHVTDPIVFYGKQDFWQIPDDPTVPTAAGAVPMRPYYLLMRLPGETEEHFVLIQPFTPQGRQNMVAWMAARSDPGAEYGTVLSYQFPSGVNVDGPTQVFSRINQDARFSTERTLLSQGGSDVLFGDFLVIPIDDGLLYVQPVYVRSTQTNAIPELKRVVVVNGDRVGIGTTLRDALADSLSGQVVPPDGGGEQPRRQRRAADPGAPRAGRGALRGGPDGAAQRRPRHLPDRGRCRGGGREPGERPRGRARGRCQPLGDAVHRHAHAESFGLSEAVRASATMPSVRRRQEDGRDARPRAEHDRLRGDPADVPPGGPRALQLRPRRRRRLGRARARAPRAPRGGPGRGEPTALHVRRPRARCRTGRRTSSRRRASAAATACS